MLAEPSSVSGSSITRKQCSRSYDSQNGVFSLVQKLFIDIEDQRGVDSFSKGKGRVGAL